MGLHCARRGRGPAFRGDKGQVSGRPVAAAPPGPRVRRENASMRCSSLPSTGTPSVPLLISTDGGVRNRHPRRSSFASDVASDLHYQSQLHLLALPNVKVADLWRGYGPQPWKRATFKFSTDPQRDAKVRDVVGLYLKPPENAVESRLRMRSWPAARGARRSWMGAARRSRGPCRATELVGQDRGGGCTFRPLHCSPWPPLDFTVAGV